MGNKPGFLILYVFIISLILSSCDVFNTPEPPGTPARWAYTVDGRANVTTSTKITFNFDKDVELRVDNIIITDHTGSATRGSLSKGENNRIWTLAITVQTQGRIKVKINAPDIDDTEWEVMIHKEADIIITVLDELTITVSNVTDIIGDADIYLYKNFGTAFPGNPANLLNSALYEAKASATVNEDDELIFELEDIDIDDFYILIVNETEDDTEYWFYRASNSNISSLPAHIEPLEIDEDEIEINFNAFSLITWPKTIVVVNAEDDLSTSDSVLYLISPPSGSSTVENIIAVSGSVTKNSDGDYIFVLMVPEANAPSANYWVGSASSLIVKIDVDGEDEEFIFYNGDITVTFNAANASIELDFEDFEEPTEEEED